MYPNESGKVKVNEVIKKHVENHSVILIVVGQRQSEEIEAY